MLREALGEKVGAAASSPEKCGPELTARRLSHRFEHYELVIDKDHKPVELGRGAMGITYKAFDVDPRCPVTLKVISQRHLGDESARLRFLREARAAAKVRHSNVASVLHLGRTRNSYFYAMEFVEGETVEPAPVASTFCGFDSMALLVTCCKTRSLSSEPDVELSQF